MDGASLSIAGQIGGIECRVLLYDGWKLRQRLCPSMSWLAGRDVCAGDGLSKHASHNRKGFTK